MSTPPLPPPAPVVPHLGPPGLPVAVTAALWSTELLAGRVPVDVDPGTATAPRAGDLTVDQERARPDP